MNESEAKAALRAQGIRKPSPQLVQDYMRLQQAEEWALEVPPPPLRSVDGTESAEAKPEPKPHPSSESNLEPLLRERGELQRPAGRRKAGRPRILAPWFQALATRMADGTSMQKALASLEIHLSQREIRALYRNRALTTMRQEARQKWQREWGLARSDRRKTKAGCKGCGLGLSQEFLRSL